MTMLYVCVCLDDSQIQFLSDNLEYFNNISGWKHLRHSVKNTEGS